MSRTALLTLLLAPSLFFAQQPTKTSPPASSTHIAGHRSVALARTLSIVPGLGHAYAGEELRGVAVLGGVVGLAAVTVAGAFASCPLVDFAEDASSCGGDGSAVLVTLGGVATYGLWGWSIYDAGAAARRTNDRLSKRANSSSLSVGLGRRPTASGHDARVLNVGLRLKVR